MGTAMLESVGGGEAGLILLPVTATVALVACPGIVSANNDSEVAQRRLNKQVERATKRAIARAERKAKTGDSEAQYRLSSLIYDEDEARSFELACAAADQGHGSAQLRVGRHYEIAIAPVELRDPVRAYMWYSLAQGNGEPYAVAKRNELASGMTRDQIIEAERATQAWRPGTCGSEFTPTTATG